MSRDASANHHLKKQFGGMGVRLTHHAEIITIEGESYRTREAEQAQKRKWDQKTKP